MEQTLCARAARASLRLCRLCSTRSPLPLGPRCAAASAAPHNALALHAC